MGLLNREHDLHLFAPPLLKDILDLQLHAASASLPYHLHFHPLEHEGELVKTDKFRVSCFETQHRITCWGFKFEQVKAPRKINPEKARAQNIPASFFDRLKWGDDYIGPDGITVSNQLVTETAPKPKSYAFTADTRYDESLIEKIHSVDILYHETTYLKELEERAIARFHATTVHAAMLAKKANAGRLLIGHFSSKYERLEIFEQEAREIFPNTDLALEGVTYRV
jgi:ribonuclease Z